MKAAGVTALGEPRDIREVPVPDMGPARAPMRGRASGVRHAAHASEGDRPVKPSPPFTPGHRGEVAAGGAGATHPKEGDRIGVPWPRPARRRREHRPGGPKTFIEERRNTGHSVDGAHAVFDGMRRGTTDGRVVLRL
jgi:propanol-preferring alcohol dehydrogenase